MYFVYEERIIFLCWPIVYCVQKTSKSALATIHNAIPKAPYIGTITAYISKDPMQVMI
jgi:hypothetical protein